jgi:nucleoside triphosphatase
MTTDISTRLVVVPIVRDEHQRILLCKMPPHRGVFPDQWGLPGGGMEPGERMHQALNREVREELGVSIVETKPLFFKDGLHEKTFPDGSKQTIYMIFLLFECRISSSETICLNPEFCDYAWVEPGQLSSYDINSATKETFESLGLLVVDDSTLSLVGASDT